MVVDDEPQICKNCVKILEKLDYEVQYALNGRDALEMMAEDGFDVVVTDLKMSRLGGMEVLRQVAERFPDTRVVVITGYASVSSAVETMKLGAFDYLPKPFSPDELRSVVGQALEERRSLLQNRRLRQERERPSGPVSHQLVGNSAKMQKVVSMIQKVAPTDANVLVYGESGTGKELVSRAVHANSLRKDRVFFAVDCGTLSGDLLENELFGHAKGAFTDAHQEKKGIFTQADKGTVFLDEIANVDTEVQGKLLRFLESREFLPLGYTKPVKVDVRLIFATNRNLQDMVLAGSFREDFYYRIFVYPIMLPPLRERREDILPIAYHFLEQFNRKMNKSIEGFERETANRMTNFQWPGNVRQLRNAVERAAILCEGRQITMAELPVLSEIEEIEHLIEHVPSTNEELKKIKKEIRQKAVAQVERNFVRNALAQNDWNVTQAAKAVGLQRPNFHNLMKKHNITLPK